MKKVLLGLLVAGALSVGVFFYLREYLAKAEIHTRIDNMIEQTNGYRHGLSTKDDDLLAYFVIDKYDQTAPHPYQWLETWKAENWNPDFERKITEVNILEHTPTDAKVEFTVLEGLKGNEQKGLKAAQSSFKYDANLTFDTGANLWKIRSLRRKGG